MNPEMIQSKQFSVRKFKGYDPEEVDAFLDDIYEAYQELLGQIRNLQNQNERLRKEPATEVLPNPLIDMSRMLQVAQRTADEHIAEANGQAGGILAKAQKQADAIVAEGHGRKLEIIGDLEVQRSNLEGIVKALNDGRVTAVTQLRMALEALEKDE